MAINVLSEQLASQIAAGEVVERPASVVKELVENALDAGATTINVDIRAGGRELVQVADNGQGIAAHDLEKAFLRHATSKLEHIDDLEAIPTLGFRGEALAAIAAVSQLTVVSRTEAEPAGTRLVLDGGQKMTRESVGAPRGTVIAVENLFFNVPARMKFLKSELTEKRLIDEFVTRYALAHPKVRFRLVHDNRIAFQSNGSGDVKEVLLSIYGSDLSRQLLEIERSDSTASAAEGRSKSGGDLLVSGVISPPDVHWSNRSRISLFVNGRWIKDRSIAYAVIQAYHTLIPSGRYPLAIIFISLPYDQVDVNVHPAKTEVRFRSSNQVFGAVQRAVRQTLITQSPVRSMSAWAGGDAGDTRSPGWAGVLDEHAFQKRDGDAQRELNLDWSVRLATRGLDSEPVGEVQGSRTAGETLQNEKLPIMRVIGQVGAAYIITEGPDGLYLIDQHAAHERILFEQFMGQYDHDGVISQGLITGTAVHLPPSQAELLAENIQLLNSLGFQIEIFGPNQFMVRAVPAVVAKLDPARALIAVVEDLERQDVPLRGKIEEKIVLRVCKSAAIKAGQTLSQREMEALVMQLEACHNPHTCPHGRPTLIHLSVAQLAKQFGRT
ncbi:MAG: DNA mismatch repair endonuclease MutL [Candidatus Promineifilaceae bacterium]|nr:DNA mismatch repair endonuclease MutL [Candidatus Promineifilaceae bacterium]